MAKHHTQLDRRFSVAPMLGKTDRYCRYFFRQISQHALLYTEMITTGALLHNHPASLLDYHPDEHPLAIQLAGNDPNELFKCTKIADEWGYDEINLNVGCPSDRVQSGGFGACLMAKPDLVAECVSAMRAATSKPVSVKHRIGIDENDSYEALSHFIETVANAGCTTFIVHARKAWLQGLSPKENRDIPPLRYEWVHQLKQDFSDYTFVINGGINNLQDIDTQLKQVDGVMSGRAVYADPWLLSEIDQHLYSAKKKNVTRQQVIENMLPFIQALNTQGVPLSIIIRPIFGLFQGQPGARQWRRYLSENAHKPGASIETIQNALQYLTAPEA